MAKRKNQVPEVDSFTSDAFRIAGELLSSPVLYAGEIGTFGLGGPIRRKPLQRYGLPPVDREDIPEATPEQYTQLLNIHGNGYYGIYRAEPADAPSGSEPG